MSLASFDVAGLLTYVLQRMFGDARDFDYCCNFALPHREATTGTGTRIKGQQSLCEDVGRIRLVRNVHNFEHGAALTNGRHHLSSRWTLSEHSNTHGQQQCGTGQLLQLTADLALLRNLLRYSQQN